MKPFINEANKRYGKLKVLSLASTHSYGHCQWKCICDCGKETIVTGTNLRTGNTKSCGCIQYEPKPSVRDRQRKRPFEWLYLELRRSTKRREMQCSISYEEFLKFTRIKQCFYCGEKLEWQEYSPHIRNKVAYNLDRLDNNLGYLPENCVGCCAACNFLKGTKSKENFLMQIEKIHLYQKQGRNN